MQRKWHGKAERLRGFQIDCEIEFSHLHNRQVSRLGTLEDLADVDGGLALLLINVSPITIKPPAKTNSRNE